MRRMFAETEDQQLLESAARRFLGSNHSVEKVRALAGAPSAFEPSLWKEAAQLGWTALLAPEAAGGGSISDNGLSDLLIVAYQLGQHAAPAPLLGVNAVVCALGRWGSPEQRKGPLAELIAGNAVAAWAHPTLDAAPAQRRSRVSATAARDSVVLRGRATQVESAADAKLLLVSADEPAGRSHFLVPLDCSGVERKPLHGVDPTQRFGDVELHDVVLPDSARVGAPGAAEAHDAALFDVAAVVLLGEIVGCVERAFAITLEWTANRHSFGRPLASYQVIKHRMADLRTGLEASAAVASRAAIAVGSGAADARSWVSAGMTYVGRTGPEIIQDCIQLHGGIGVTYDNDLHLFLRRAMLNANRLGSPSDFARQLGSLAAAARGAAA